MKFMGEIYPVIVNSIKYKIICIYINNLNCIFNCIFKIINFNYFFKMTYNYNCNNFYYSSLSSILFILERKFSFPCYECFICVLHLHITYIHTYNTSCFIHNKCQPRVFLHVKKKPFRRDVARKAPFHACAILRYGAFFMGKRYYWERSMLASQHAGSIWSASSIFFFRDRVTVRAGSIIYTGSTWKVGHWRRLKCRVWHRGEPTAPFVNDFAVR